MFDMFKFTGMRKFYGAIFALFTALEKLNCAML